MAQRGVCSIYIEQGPRGRFYLKKPLLIHMKHLLTGQIERRIFSLEVRRLGAKDFEKKLIHTFMNSLFNRIESLNLLLNPLNDDIPLFTDSILLEWDNKRKELQVSIDKLTGGEYSVRVPLEQLHKHYRSVASQIRQKINSL